ncbi:KH homology domain-containing protein 1-like isoform X5 [Camelus bactrianus]|uniref:KH homology domain-containing protein 1-like isoform X5 n=1 Tax=Camelus bactrianus TaxID=9837 RepID=A0AC58P7R4_CAMBA
MELWMLPVLFGLEGELMALHQWFRVFLVVSAVPGCGVLIFIIGPPFYQCFTMLLIVAMSFQLRIRDNRGSSFPHFSEAPPLL